MRWLRSSRASRQQRQREEQERERPRVLRREGSLDWESWQLKLGREWLYEQERLRQLEQELRQLERELRQGREHPDAWSAARKAWQEAVRDGAVSIGGPSRMEQGSTADVVVTVSEKAADMERLREEVSKYEQGTVLATDVTPHGRVTCVGDGFTVTPVTPPFVDDQVVAIDGRATWTFKVRADATGHRALLIVVHLRIPDPIGGWITRSAIEHAIYISVSPATVTLRFFRTNWQSVAGVAIGAAGAIAAWTNLLG